MFETIDNAEIYLPPIFSGEPEKKERLWSYVNLRLHIYWFHVVYSCYEDEELICKKMGFFTEIDHLIEINSQPSFEVVDVDLVSPGHFNGGRRWKMEPLKEIWKGLEPKLNHKQYGYIFILEDGKHYVDSALDTIESELQNKQCIYKI